MPVVKYGIAEVSISEVTSGDGISYDHTSVNIGTGLGCVVVPTLVKRGLTYFAMVRQVRPSLGFKSSLEFPRGGFEVISAEEAAREFVEETCLEISELKEIGRIHPDAGSVSTEIGIYAGFVRSDSIDAASGYVEVESGCTTEWVSSVELESLIRSGEVTCGITIAAFALAGCFGLVRNDV